MKKLICFITAFCLLSINTYAKDAPNTDLSESISGLFTNVKYNSIITNLNELEEKIKEDKLSKEETTKKIQDLQYAQITLLDYKKDLETDLKTVEKRIEILGPVPEGSAKETPVIEKTRKDFNKEQVDIKGKIATLDILLAKIDEIDTLISNIKNKALFANLFEKKEPLIYPAEFFHSGKLFINFFIDVLKSPLDWYESITKAKQEQIKEGLFPVLLIAFLSLWLGVSLRLFIMRHFGYKKDIENPRYGNKVIAAVFVAIAYGVIPAAIVGGFLFWNVTHRIVTSGFFGLIINSLMFYGLFVILAKAFARVVFAPYNERWRLVNVSTEKAKKITSALYFTVIMLGVMAFLEHIIIEAEYPADLKSFIGAMSSGIKAFCIILITKRLFLEDVPELSEDDEDYEQEAEQVSMAFKVTIALTVFAFAAFMLSIFGYPTLATFILDKFIITCLVIAGFLILRKAIKEILHRVLLLTFWSKTFKLRRKMIQKLDFWVFLVLEPIIIFLALFLILTIWGVSTKVLITLINKMLFGFMVGGVKISLISIVLGVLIFFLIVALFKVMKKRLMSNVLSRMDIDDGIKHSLESGFGFVGFILALLLSIVVMGGSLTNIALIAGALSFGIGLGLQNIVNNFVSGIVLLFERPVKIGDWVFVNGQEGIVKQVSIRATELETWEKSNIIIPNADILSNSLINLTHTDKIGRIDIKVGVAYGSNTQLVKDILLSVAENHKKIVKKPATFVVFTDFADSSLNFELKTYTSDVMNRLMIASEIRFEIDRLFRENGVEIPFPQRTLHLASLPPQLTTKAPKTPRVAKAKGKK